jgi:hypothetical protein
MIVRTCQRRISVECHRSTVAERACVDSFLRRAWNDAFVDLASSAGIFAARHITGAV